MAVFNSMNFLKRNLTKLKNLTDIKILDADIKSFYRYQFIFVKIDRNDSDRCHKH